MQIITFNNSSSPIQATEDSRSVRIGYLLGEKVVLAGGYSYQLSGRENGQKKSKQTFASVPLKTKIELTENFCRRHNVEEGSDFAWFGTLSKEFAKMKNKSTVYIANFKRSELQFNKIFNITVQWYEDYISQSGYFELAKLIDGQVMKTFASYWRKEEKPDKEEVKSSSILSLDFEPNGETNIFILTNHFFETPFADSFKYVDVGHADAEEAGTVYLEPLLKLPDLIYLNSAELKLIRNGLHDIRKIFCEKADTWINMCYDGSGFKERKTMLLLELLPLAERLTELIDAHPYIQHLQKVTMEEQALEVYIGEIPFQLLLQYYSHYKVIGEETLAQMKLLQEKEERFNKRWPVLIYKLAATPKSIDYQADSMALSIKKSINIE